MNVMTNTTTPAQELSELEQTVLRYYTREARGVDNTAPGEALGGLSIGRFKQGRAGLLRRGLLCRDRRGRYRPSAMQEDT